MGKQELQSRLLASRDGAGIVIANPADSPSAEHTTRPLPATCQTMDAAGGWTPYEFIDSRELARRLAVPKTWVDERVRTRAQDKIPHYKFGKYVRFAWGSPALSDWLRKRIVVSNSGLVNRVSKEKKQ